MNDATASYLTGYSTGNGGAGGGAGGKANGAAGGAGSASIDLTGANRVTVTANATGGAGGAGYGAGKQGGAGGAVSGVTASATGYSASVTVNETGGAGGAGNGGANGGTGANSSLTNAASGTVAAGGTLTLSQTATGGAGGYSSAGTGGAAGTAASSLTASDAKAGSLGGYSTANGGAGGGAGGAGNGATGGAATAGAYLIGAHVVTSNASANGGGGERAGNGTSGGAGGAANLASATASETSATGGTAYARARSIGGNGGRAYGAGAGAGGAGGGASGAVASASGYNAYASAYQRGGSGGGNYATGGGAGGAGASTTLTNGASGTTKGGYLRLYQAAIGGSGGYSAGAAGGGAGYGTSSLSLTDATASNLSGTSTGDGGAGGRSNGAAGGAGTASINLNGANTVYDTANATGGAGGTANGSGAGGAGGAASATAVAASTNLVSGTATATANATGGAGKATLAAANATATAVTAAGQQAEAISTATGSSGLALTIATTSAPGGVVSSLSSDAQAPATVLGENALSVANAVNPFGFNGSSYNAYAFGTVGPNATFVAAAFAANHNVGAVSSPGTITGLGASYSTVFGAAVQGMYNPTNATGSHEYVSSQNFTLDARTISGHLIVGLTGDQITGGGTSSFTSLVFTVTVGGVTTVSDTFTTQSAATAFFSNNAVDAGTFSSTNGLQVQVKLDLTTSKVGFGFGQSFVIGATDGSAPPVVTAPATAVVQQGQSTAIGGVSVSEATGLAAGQTVTVTLSDTVGLLAQSAGMGTVTGQGTTSLTLTGTVAQVNADLATLTDTDAALPGDTITLTSSDSRTGDGAPVTIGVTVNAPPTITVGGAQVFSQGVAKAITGVSIADANEPGAGETFTVTVADAVGLLSATGTGVSGSGTTSLTITGSLAQVNADLATLADTEGAPGSDTITVNANDGQGGVAAPQTIGLTVSGAPAITAPASVTAPEGKATAVSGVSLSESNVTAGETFTVTLADAMGVLKATGAGVSGSGTTSLTITGSLGQVNADLATLTDTEGAPGTDTLTIGATDSNGGSATPTTTTVTTNGPVISVPNRRTIGVGQMAAIKGIKVSEVGKASTVTLTLKDSTGLLSAIGTGVSGSGTTTLTLTGTVAQVNADLATLTDTNNTVGKDSIKLTASDNLGQTATGQSVPVTVNGIPVITAPATATVTQGKASAIKGVSLTESGSTKGETFTVTLSDANGLLTASGKGVTGSGTTSLTITGSLPQVNGDLASLKDNEPAAGGDTITVIASDSLGNSAAPASIAVTAGAAARVPPPPLAPANPHAFIAAMAGFSGEWAFAAGVSPTHAGMGWRPILAAGEIHRALA